MAQDAFYDITLSKLIQDNLPEEKRTVENESALNGLMAGFNRTHNAFLDFKRGADVWFGWSFWIATTWIYGEKCIYFLSGEVYECVVPSTTAEPTQSDDWQKVSDSFIGNDEIMTFNGTKLSLEYALNRRFYTGFQQPPAQSDIYISTINNNPLVFVVGGNASNSSNVYSNTSSEFVINSTLFTTINDFTIYVPTSTYSLLGADADNIIRSFVDKYVTFGLKYLIQQY
jgi:hypothetical protein